MRFFDQDLVANSKPHARWWDEVCASRACFHDSESRLAQYSPIVNASSVLPRDAWLELDGITRRIMRADEGASFMNDLMPLAKAVHIGKLVHMSRVSGDAGVVVRSMSGQVPVPVDKVGYDYAGTPVPIFSTAYGREWREWNTLQSENFDALTDDQEATTAKLRQNMAEFVLDGDLTIKFQGYTAYGIRTNPLSIGVNLGNLTGPPAGANIDLSATATTADAIDAFFTGYFGAILDANLITQPVNIYVSLAIARNFDRSYSSAAGYKDGTVLQYLLTNRRINKIVATAKLTGNQFIAFVPSADYIRPLIGMAVNTTAIVRNNPTDNYQFLTMGALGLEIRADINGLGGVFYSEVVNN